VELIKYTQKEEGKDCLKCLEDPGIDLNDLDGKKLLCTAMSSYYLLYR